MHARQKLYQLSHQGSSWADRIFKCYSRAKASLEFLDKQGNSIQYCGVGKCTLLLWFVFAFLRTCTYTYACMYTLCTCALALNSTIVYSRSPEPRKWLWFTRLRKCASLLQLPSYLRATVCAGIWAWSELCIRARLRVDLRSTLALPLQEVSTHQNHS